MTNASDPPPPSTKRERIVKNVESLGILELDLPTDQKRSRRLTEILEHLSDHVIDQIDSRLLCEVAPDNSSVEAFAEKNGISTAEKKLLIAMVAGHTVGQHADNLGISINTARTHARRLLEKTGSQNQVDLIRKLIR